MRIPKDIPEKSGITESSANEMASHSDRVVTGERPYKLADLLNRVTDDNLHRERDTGAPRGKEHW